MKAIPESTLHTLINLQAFVVNDDLPAGTAGVGTGTCNTGKLFIIIRSCNLHKKPPGNSDQYISNTTIVTVFQSCVNPLDKKSYRWLTFMRRTVKLI